MNKKYYVQVSMNQAAIVKTGLVWKQGDFGFQVEIEVLDFDTSGTTPQIVFRKSAGAVESTDVSVVGNVYTYTFKGTELDVPGFGVCDLKLKNSTTQRISTASFMYECIADTLDGLNQQANSYSDTIEQLVDGFESNVKELGSSVETFLPLTELPAENAWFEYPVDIKSNNNFPITLSITDGGEGGYYFYALYNNEALVWGSEEESVWVPAGTTNSYTVTSEIVADKLKVWNRNARTGTKILLSSNAISALNTRANNLQASLGKQYDVTKIYNVGDFALVGDVLYQCWYSCGPESFHAWKWVVIGAINSLIQPVYDVLWDENETLWYQGAINYSTGYEESSSVDIMTGFISNVGKVVGNIQTAGIYYFGVFVYKNGEYIGMLHSDGTISIPTGSTVVISYADLSGFDNSYTFRFVQYNSGAITEPIQNIVVRIYRRKYEIVENSGIIHETILKVGTGLHYTSLRTALEYAATIANEKNHVTVQFYGNGTTYDVSNDITAADLETTSTWPGLIVPAHCKLIGMGSREQNKIALTLPNSIDPDVAFRISTINLYEDAELENLWIYGKGCRYACHDDMMTANPTWDLKTIKNCRFTSDFTNQHRAYGAGYRSGVNWRFENCIFENINGEGTQYGNAAFSAHNNSEMVKSANLTFVNCQASGGSAFNFESLNRTSEQSYANAITMISFYGCKAVTQMWDRPIQCTITSADAALEVDVTGFGNSFDNNDVAVYYGGNYYNDRFTEQLTLWGKITEV